LTPPLSLHAWLRYDAVHRLLPGDVRRILEIGTGLGSFGVLLAEQFEYVGLEPDPASFEVAAERLAGRAVVLNETAETYTSPEPFDVVCAFEVLEHVADDRKALRELLRVARADGFVQLTVPSPYTRATTTDWGYPDARAHGHYRGYGRDFLARFGEARPDAAALEVEVFDPATAAGSYVYLWSASAARIEQLARWIGV